MKLAIVGCGTYGQVYLSYLRHHTDNEMAMFLDDDQSIVGTTVQGVQVLGTTDDLPQLKQQGVEGVVAPIGDNEARVRILECARCNGLETPNFVHPTAIVSEDARLGTGVYILPGSIVMPYADIHDFVMISMGVKVAHHTTLHRGVFLSTGVNMGAGVDVCECAYLGIGATVMTGVKVIGARSLIGAGAVVIRDVLPETTVAGVPAKPMQKS